MSPTAVPSPDEALIEHVAGLRRIARRLVADASRAEDVVQETMRVALEKRDHRGASLGAWLAGVARNVARHLARGERRHVERARAAPRREHAPATADLVARVAEHRMVLDAVLALDEPYRSTVILRYFDGESARRIAARLGVPVETVRTRLRRAIEKLRLSLDAKHGGRRDTWRAGLLPIAYGGGLVARTAALIAGGVVVKKIAAAAGVLIALALSGWLLGVVPGNGGAPSPVEGPPPAALDARPSETLAGRGKPVGRPDDEGLPPAPVDLATVDRDRDLHGVVVTPDGTPIAGARLDVVRYPWRRAGFTTLRGHWEAEVGPSTRSAMDGTFAIRLERGRSVNLRASARGRARTELDSVSAGEWVRVVLPEPVTLEVHAVDESGKGAPGVRVHLFSTGGGSGTVALQRRGVTDEAGLLRFDDLHGGFSITLDVEHDVLGDPGWQDVELPVRGEKRFELTMPTGRTVRGRVTDARTNQPVAGARVGINYMLERERTTDADGRYVLPGWTGKAAYTIHVLAAGYGPGDKRVRDADVVDFALVPGAEVVGRVVDAHRRPVLAARITSMTVGTDASRPGSAMPSALTDAEGRFRLAGLRADLPARLAFRSDGHGRLSHLVAAPLETATATDLGDLVLEPSQSVAGVVVDANGSPVARVVVSITRGRVRDPRDQIASDFTYSDDLGRFRFHDVPPGVHVISVRPARLPEQKRELEVAADTDVEAVSFVLSGGRPLRIVVSDERGAPVREVTVHVVGTGGGTPQTGKTDDSGAVDLVVSSVASHVTLRFPSDPPRIAEPSIHWLGAREREVRFVLRDVAPTRGRIEDDAGRPIGGLTVSVERNGRVESSGPAAGEDGRFEVLVPVGQRVALVVTGAGQRKVGSGIQLTHLPYEGRIDGVRAGEQGTVLKVHGVGTDRSVRVRVLLPDGTPASEAHVYASPRPPDQQFAPRTDDSGMVVLTGLFAQPTTLRAHAWNSRTGDALLDSVEERVVPDGQEVVLRVRPGRRAHVVTKGPDGKPVPGAAVWIVREGGHPTMNTSGDAGVALFDLDPAAGPVDLMATATLPDGRVIVGTALDVASDAGTVTVTMK